MEYIFGIDLGGTSVKFGLFDQEGLLLDKWEIKTRTEDNGEHIISDIAASVESKIKEKDIDKSKVIGVGIAVPGPVVNDSTVIECVNLGWGRKNVSQELGEILGLQVYLGNDADAAALGEMWQGGGKGYDSIFMVTLGTGVGGGLVIDGRIITGANGTAWEIGHVTVDYNEEMSCNCGKKGCLEQYASATGITRLGRDLLASSSEPSKLRDYKELSAKAIFDCAKEGDKLALDLTNTFGRYLGLALSHVASIADPQVFVIGGGVSRAGDIIIDVCKDHYRDNVMKSIKDTEITLATLGNDAGIYGSAKMVLK
ncbi:MAG: ROK family glucokinase [Clostridiales bacterium]|nr:ROK family glucokinase [Clostridiales bacterium]